MVHSNTHTVCGRLMIKHTCSTYMVQSSLTHQWTREHEHWAYSSQINILFNQFLLLALGHACLRASQKHQTVIAIFTPSVRVCLTIVYFICNTKGARISYIYGENTHRRFYWIHKTRMARVASRLPFDFSIQNDTTWRHEASRLIPCIWLNPNVT